MKTLAKNLLEMFCKIILNNKDIVKSILVPDNNFWFLEELSSINGLTIL